MEHVEGFSRRMVDQSDLPEIGSSLTVEGWRKRGYVQRLELHWRTGWPHLGFDFDNRAQGGATSRTILQRVRAWSAAGGTADLAFLGCGINDVWRTFQGRTHEAVDIHEFSDNYQETVQLLAGASLHLVCIGETPFGWDTELDVTLLNRELAAYNAVAARIAAQESADFIDVWHAFTATAKQFSSRVAGDGSGETLWSDGVHLSELGDALMLRLVDDHVREHRLIEAITAGRRPFDDGEQTRAIPDPHTEPHAFMAEYERATNTHDINQVAPLI
jgi:lysophospholipase L1-like esterase